MIDRTENLKFSPWLIKTWGPGRILAIAVMLAVTVCFVALAVYGTWFALQNAQEHFLTLGLCGALFGCMVTAQLVEPPSQQESQETEALKYTPPSPEYNQYQKTVETQKEIHVKTLKTTSIEKKLQKLKKIRPENWSLGPIFKARPPEPAITTKKLALEFQSVRAIYARADRDYTFILDQRENTALLYPIDLMEQVLNNGYERYGDVDSPDNLALRGRFHRLLVHILKLPDEEQQNNLMRALACAFSACADVQIEAIDRLVRVYIDGDGSIEGWVRALFSEFVESLLTQTIEKLHNHEGLQEPSLSSMRLYDGRIPTDHEDFKNTLYRQFPHVKAYYKLRFSEEGVYLPGYEKASEDTGVQAAALGNPILYSTDGLALFMNLFKEELPAFCEKVARQLSCNEMSINAVQFHQEITPSLGENFGYYKKDCEQHYIAVTQKQEDQEEFCFMPQEIYLLFQLFGCIKSI